MGFTVCLSKFSELINGSVVTTHILAVKECLSRDRAPVACLHCSAVCAKILGRIP